jgi:sterol desaturase/sphingolipid hydroxylase (fatty acid hydroxylase superfamily)
VQKRTPPERKTKRSSVWPSWATPAIAAAAFAAIAYAEARRPLRERRESKARRMGRNFVTAGLTAAVTSALQIPLLQPMVERVARDRLGLLNQIGGPRLLRRVLGVLLLDYTLWWWHFANHRAASLWRFHLVHHVDRDLDASTAIRFHFGEMSLSVFYRMAQVRLLGVDQAALTIWQTLLLVSIVFHHSNLRLPRDLERQLVLCIVTPRMHGIHHSDYRDETDSNWSSLLSWWDWLHGTMRLDVEQRAIEIGVPAYRQPDAVTLGKITTLPFRPQREDWRTPEGVPRIERRGPAGDPELLPG